VRLAAILLAILLAGPSAAAGIDERAIGAARAAAADLRKAVALANAEGAAPRLSAARHAALFDAALPASAAEPGSAAPAEFPLLVELSRLSATLARAYVLVGVDAPRESELTAEQRQRAARNLIQFLPELARLYDYRVAVTARLAQGAADARDAMAPSVREDAAVAAGFAAIGREAQAAIETVLGAASDANIDPGWRIERMAALVRAASAYAALLDTRAGQTVADRALAHAIAETNAAMATLMKNFALAVLR
jgi:hypothetical protein